MFLSSIRSLLVLALGYFSILYRCVYICANCYIITPQMERKKYIMNEKPQKYMCMPYFLSQPERFYWSLTPQVEAVIIEVSTVQVLGLRVNPWWLHGAKHLPSTNWIYGDTWFYSGQTTYLWKLLFFLKLLLDLSYDQKCWHFTDHTRVFCSCSSGTLCKTYGR